MTLEQLLSFEDVDEYGILWYGYSEAKNFLSEDGLLLETVTMLKQKPKSANNVYLIMSGLTKYKCVYMFAITFIATDKENEYKWKRVPLKMDEYAGRLVLYREFGFSFYNAGSLSKDFIVEEIWGKKENRTVKEFTDYDNVELSFSELKEVIEGHYPDYYKALSVVKGIYMIIDGNTGKQYIGSAYGEDGIWGRWASYAQTYHGDNLELKKLYEEKENKEAYFREFKYIILQIVLTKMSDKEIIELETKYKNRFLTKKFGLNSN